MSEYNTYITYIGKNLRMANIPRTEVVSERTIATSIHGHPFGSGVVTFGSEYTDHANENPTFHDHDTRASILANGTSTDIGYTGLMHDMELQDRDIDRLKRLNVRQKDILKMAAEMYPEIPSNEMLANALKISSKTAETYKSQVRQGLQTKTFRLAVVKYILGRNTDII
jgi:hypothetical protein